MYWIIFVVLAMLFVFFSIVKLVGAVNQKNKEAEKEQAEKQFRKDVINAASGNVQSAADELKKYKELLDQGIITEQEYQAKKEQLLKLM